MTPQAMLRFGVVWTAVSLAMLAGGVALLVRDRRLKKRLVYAIGQVIETVESPDPDNGDVKYHPVIEYRDEAKRVFHKTDDTLHGKPTWKVGDPWTVRYDPSDPAVVLLSDATGAREFGGMFALVGVLLTAIGAFFMAAGVLGPRHPTIVWLSQFFSQEP